MKALAIAAACILLCQPAYAFGRGPAGQGGGFHHGGHGFGHRGSGLVFNGTGFWGPAVAPVEAPPPVVVEQPAPAPIVIAAPAPLCPMPGTTSAEAPPVKRGPHIIYIGHKPEIRGPKVIYGTD